MLQLFTGNNPRTPLATLKWVFFLTSTLLLSGCNQPTEKAHTASEPTCSTCNQLDSFLQTLAAKFDSGHPFRMAADAYTQSNSSIALADFFGNKQESCREKLQPRLKDWLNNLTDQAEKIAAKQQSCTPACPRVNCGEYVDFLGMNMEIIELLTLLEDRFIDRALNSVAITGLNTDQIAELQTPLIKSLNQGGATIANIANILDQPKSAPYQQALIDLSHQLESISQQFMSAQWSAANHQNTVALAEFVQQLSKDTNQLAYEYQQLFATADGGKATAATQEKLATITLGLLHRVDNLHALLQEQATINTTTNADNEMACFEALAIEFGVTKALYSVAADTVAECAQQLSCKTQATPLFDAITQNQQSTDALLKRLANTHEITPKIVHSYSSKSCH